LRAAESHGVFRARVRKALSDAAVETDQDLAGRTLPVRCLRKALKRWRPDG